MVKRFLASGRSGFIWRSLERVKLALAMRLQFISRDGECRIGLRDYAIVRFKAVGTEELASLRRALQIAALPEDWKEYFRERMQKMNV